MTDGVEEAKHGSDPGKTADHVQVQEAGAQLAKAAARSNDGQQDQQPEQIAGKHDHLGVEVIGQMLDHGGHHRQQTLTEDQ